MLLWIVAIMTVGVMLGLAYYLRAIPEGPLCPRCGDRLERLEAGGGGNEGDDRAEPLIRRWVVSARCRTCGWDGRIRRGPEPEVARAKRSES